MLADPWLQVHCRNDFLSSQQISGSKISTDHYNNLIDEKTESPIHYITYLKSISYGQNQCLNPRSSNLAKVIPTAVLTDQEMKVDKACRMKGGGPWQNPLIES